MAGTSSRLLKPYLKKQAPGQIHRWALLEKNLVRLVQLHRVEQHKQTDTNCRPCQGRKDHEKKRLRYHNYYPALVRMHHFLRSLDSADAMMCLARSTGLHCPRRSPSTRLTALSSYIGSISKAADFRRFGHKSSRGCSESSCEAAWRNPESSLEI